MKKKLVSVLLAISLVFTAIGITNAYADSSNDFIYFETDGNATIIGFDGVLEGKLVIPSEIDGFSVTAIDDSAFRQQEKITDVVIPDGVKTIGHAAFMYSSIESVTIPASVESIGDSVFDYCPNFKQVTIDENSLFFCNDENGVLYNKDKTTLVRYPAALELTNFDIPDSVSAITDNAFQNAVLLENVTIPEGIEVIGNRAFFGCFKLDNLVLPSTVKKIGQMAFVETAHYFDSNKWDSDGVLYIGSNLIDVKDVFTQPYAIKDGTTLLADDAFANSGTLTNVTFPSSLKSISYRAFTGCLHLNNVVIPDTIEAIESYAFSNCFELEKIEIPNSVKTIGGQAFYTCFALSEVSLPDSITTIEAGTFASCYSLESITIPDCVTVIEQSAFDNCKKLKDISLPAGITSIGENAFHATAFTDFVIPEGIAEIKEYTFAACDSLESITIPDTVIKVDAYAFLGCSDLTDVYYTDTQEEWENVAISPELNEALLNANVHFNHIVASIGDVDGDGRIISSDALLILQGATGLLTLTEQQQRLADLDKDGTLSSFDALIVLQYATGLITEI